MIDVFIKASRQILAGKLKRAPCDGAPLTNGFRIGYEISLHDCARTGARVRGQQQTKHTPQLFHLFELQRAQRRIVFH